MRSYLLVLLYLTDEAVSILTPVSSGPFALFLIVYCLTDKRFDRRARTPRSMRKLFLALLVAGAAGAMMSGTSLSPLFFITIALLYGLWGAGARLREGTTLFPPKAALFGVILSVAFYLLSLAGFDLFSTARGITSNRPAGLFLEPSHLALFVTPLWFVAFQVRRYRMLLIACLVFFAATVFTVSLLALVGITVGLGYALRARALGQIIKSSRNGVLAACLVLGLVYSMPGLLTVDGLELPNYINARVLGFFASEGDENFGISTLVILQGFEISWLSVSSSAGLGVGLGNLGVNESINALSPTREIITRATADLIDLNLRDGAILINKIVGEMGLLALAFAWMVVRYLLRIRAMSPSPVREWHIVFAALGLTLLFVRGLPYFSAPTCMVIVSMASVVMRPAAAALARRTRRQRQRPFVQAG